MKLRKNTAHIIGCTDGDLAYRKARELTRGVPGKAPEISYDELSGEVMALSRIMAQDPTCVIVKDCPVTQYAINFMVSLTTPKKLPCDLPGKPFSMKPAPYFIFLINKTLPVKVTYPELIIENIE